MREVIQEAAAHGAVTSKSLREADQRLRRKMRRRRRLFANPSTWDAIAGLGTIGFGLETFFAARIRSRQEVWPGL